MVNGEGESQIHGPAHVASLICLIMPCGASDGGLGLPPKLVPERLGISFRASAPMRTIGDSCDMQCSIEAERIIKSRQNIGAQFR